MTNRKFRHENGSWWLRAARTHEPMNPDELARWIAEQVADGHEPLISPGVYLGWYSPKTPEEEAADNEHAATAKERQDKWERETYERLRAKYDAEAVEQRGITAAREAVLDQFTDEQTDASGARVIREHQVLDALAVDVSGR